MVRLFYRTTPIRISLLIIGIYLISLSENTQNWIYFSIGTLLITCREFIFNIEFYHGFLHYYRTKILGLTHTEANDAESSDELIHGF